MVFSDKTSRFSRLIVISTLAFSGILTASAQNGVVKSRNNPFAPSPKLKAAVEEKHENTSVVIAALSKKPEAPPVAPPKEVSITKPPAATVPAGPALEIYKVATGDTLFINLLNAPKGAGTFTVGENGSIDYPLANTNVTVAGLTVDEIAYLLASSIKLYNNPKFEVKVRQFNSHRINVAGLVENPGDMCIQREEVPLYVIRAAAFVKSGAATVSIKRFSGTTEKYDLHNPATENVLIRPGDSLEFSGIVPPAVSAIGSISISGEIRSAGQKAFQAGMTLSQAIGAAGGTNGNPKKAKITRRGSNGQLGQYELNLRSIREGKSVDPLIEPGDLIEILK